MTDDASWEDRLEHAFATFSRFVPDAEPARVLASMERRMGALGTFAFAAVGEMWDRPQLARRDRSLMIIAVLAAQSRAEELELHTAIGLRHGLSRTEIEEINLHIAAYAGFPAAMAASRRMDAAFCEAEGVHRIEGREPAEHLSDAERLAAGRRCPRLAHGRACRCRSQGGSRRTPCPSRRSRRLGDEVGIRRDLVAAGAHPSRQVAGGDLDSRRARAGGRVGLPRARGTESWAYR